MEEAVTLELKSKNRACYSKASGETAYVVLHNASKFGFPCNINNLTEIFKKILIFLLQTVRLFLQAPFRLLT